MGAYERERARARESESERESESAREGASVTAPAAGAFSVRTECGTSPPRGDVGAIAPETALLVLKPSIRL